MELRVLNYFLVAAREENFTRAAEQLHVTQPTLSRQIADLEQELGVKLFTRSNHNIILTEDGMILKRRAQELLSLADKTKNDFLRREENLEGTIAIGSGEFLATRVLTESVAAFSRKHPLVQFELYSGNAGNVREGMERGLLDVGLMSEPIDIRKYDFVSVPVIEKWGAWVREDSTLAGLSAITPGEHGLLSDLDDSNGKSVGATLAAWLIICAGQAVLAKFAEIYFRNVLAAGTPFTQSGAGELRRLGIMTMIIPTGCAVLGEILQEIIAGFMNVTAGGWEELNFDNEASVVVGVMFLVGSFLCGYGAEMSAENNINLLQE